MTRSGMYGVVAASVLGVLAGAGWAQGPGGTTVGAAPVAGPLFFDGASMVQYAAADAFQMRDGGMIDLHFRPTWDPTGKDMPEGMQFPVDRCLLACTEGPGKLRYQVYVNGDMSGFMFWSGREVRMVACELRPGRWYHLAILMGRGRAAFVVDGAPVGTVDVGPDTSFEGDCPLTIGSDAFQHNQFYGEVEGFRAWRRALPLNEIAEVSKVALPNRADLWSCLGAYTEWTATGATLAVVDREKAGARVLAEKNSAAWVADGADWIAEMNAAKEAAKAKKQLIIAYSTSVDGYDVTGAAVEGSSLSSAWWRALGSEHPLVLLTASESTPAPLGVPVGRCGVFNADGRLLRVFVPLSPEFTDWVLKSTGEAIAAAASTDEPVRAVAYAQRAEWLENAALVARLKECAAREDLPETTRSAVEYALQLSEVRALNAAYAARAAIVVDETSVAFEEDEAHEAYARRALELFEGLSAELEPDPRLADYAHLVWDGLQAAPDSPAADDVYNFVVPMSMFDPILAVKVASTMPGVEAPAEKGPEAGEKAK